jgi:hypothetical protein
MWMACLALALQVDTAAAAPFDAAAAAKLIQQSTEFIAASGRSKLVVGRMQPISESSPPEGYFVEASWTRTPPEGGESAEQGIAIVGLIDKVGIGERILAQDGRFVLVDLKFDRKWNEFMSEVALSRASAAESNAIARLRSIMMGQSVFADSADGAYAAELRCLADPAQCLAGYIGPGFVFSADEVQDGYRFVLHGRRSSTAPLRMSGAFAVTATPDPGSELRAFCADAKRFCVLPGTKLAPDATECPASCTDLE